jgi:predicted small lipoprotein YifL
MRGVTVLAALLLAFAVASCGVKGDPVAPSEAAEEEAGEER